jgi:hypothetical protein
LEVVFGSRVSRDLELGGKRRKGRQGGEVVRNKAGNSLKVRNAVQSSLQEGKAVKERFTI